MELYEVDFNEELNKGVYSISLVADPAIKANFISLSEQKDLKFSTVDEEQKILVGPLLIPEQIIYRNQGGKKFNIKFSAETIKKVQLNWAKNGYQNNSTIEHGKENIEDVTFVETWIKEDSVHDKSLHYGFSDEPIGTLFAMQKINNDVIWNDFVKTGKVKGFSIDGNFNSKKVNLKSDYMGLESIVEAIKEGFNSFKLSENVALATAKLVDGTVLEAEAFEAGKAVNVVDEAGVKTPAPIGEHELEDGTILVIVEVGVIAEIKEKQVEPTDNNENETLLKSIVTAMSTEVAKQIEAVRLEFSAKLEAQKPVKVALSGSETKPKPETFVTKDYGQMTNIEKLKFNREN